MLSSLYFNSLRENWVCFALLRFSLPLSPPQDGGHSLFLRHQAFATRGK